MKTVVLRTPQDVISWRKSLSPTASVGFVPTMGALHLGHETLIQKARSENDFAVLSIFVNPTQFNDKNDFEKYPLTWDSDLALATKNNVDIVWAPTFEMMYPDQYRYKISENQFSKELCGKSRPGHFDGVLTVVMKLLNVAQPTRSYFGEKDHQQLTLVKEMVESFFLPYTIIPVPTVRELDGLAMSSRNKLLSKEFREVAPLIYQALKANSSAATAQAEIEKSALQVDYIEDFKGRRYAAVRAGEVRLIDNIEI